jgi:DMSO reductase anchor subunit
MHPARSVILFTVLSGTGYGMLFLLGYGAATRLLPPDRILGLAAFGMAVTFATAGLLASLFHLGRPERAWRAMSQWRSSWLSREGLLATAVYLPTAPFGIAWAFFGLNSGVFAFFGAISGLLAAATVVATGKIYSTLKPIRQWHNAWVLPGYLVIALMSGALWLNVLLQWRGLSRPTIAFIAAGGALAGLVVKVLYWRSIDTARGGSTAESATGLGAIGRVRLLESPHTQDNFLLREMGYRIARKHAWRLRRIALSFGFFVPFVLAGLTAAFTGRLAAWTALTAALSAGLGILVERWLFFAEARHTVTLYYGAERA